MVENVTWKFQKLNFASSFHQYSNPCEEYFGGEELKVGTILSTVPNQKNSLIDQIIDNVVGTKFQNYHK